MAQKKTAIIDVETKSAEKSLNALRKQITDLKAELYGAEMGAEDYNEKLRQLDEAQTTLAKFMAETRRGCAALEGSYNALSYQMGVLKQQYKETNDEAQRGELAKQINDLNDKLKEMDEAVGVHSRNVGNYTKSMTEAFQNVGLSIGNLNPLFTNLANGMMEAGQKGGAAFANLGTAAKGLGTQLKALAANPVGAVIMAIVIAVKAAKAIFDKFKESVQRNEVAQNNLKKAMAPLQAIINGITNAFDSFVEVLTAGAAAIGEFVGSVMKWMGIDEERVEAEENIAQMEIENAEMKRKYIEENAKLDMEASEARAKASEKDKYTNKERIAFLQEYKDKQDQIAKNNLDQAQRELALLEEQAAQGKNDAAMNDKIAEAKANVYRVQQAYNDKLRETNAQMAELNNQIKAEEEATKKANEEKAKKWADEIKRLKEEYKGLITSYDDAANSDNLEYKIMKLQEKQREEVQKLTEQYKKHAITKKQFDQAIYKSENWLYQETMKLEKEHETARQAAFDHYNSLVQSSTKTAITALEREAAAEIEALANLDLTEADYEEMADNIRKAYSTKIQKTKNELYIKDAQEHIAIADAASELQMNHEEAALRNSYANREISLKEYLEQSFELQQENLQNQIEAQTQYLGELDSLYETGKIDLETYTEMVTATETNILNLQATVQENIKAQAEQNRDEMAQTFITLTDLMSEYISSITSIGDGISSQWANVFSTISDGISKVGQQLKSGEKAWKVYAQVAVSALSVASSMMMAMADEQDESTREGFETQKKYQIGATIINTLAGIVSAVSSSMSIPFPGNIIVAALLSTMMATLGGIQVAKISSTQYGGNSGTSASTQSASPNTAAISNIQAPVQWSSTVEGASQTEQVKDTRVYVVQSDIYDTNKAVSVEQSENRF